MLDQIRRMLAYDTWANQRTLESVRSVAQPSARLVALAAHIFGSKRMWLGRIRGNEDALATTWPELSLAESDTLEHETRAEWLSYAGELTDADLATQIHYSIKDVGPGMQTVADILMHKFLHAAYHRGQIAQLVRQEGGTPASTDLVVWAKAVRESQTS